MQGREHPRKGAGAIAAAVVVVAMLVFAAPASAFEYLTQWGGLGSDPGQFTNPYGIATGPDGTVYVVDVDNSRIQKFSSTGAFLDEWGGPGPAEDQLSLPQDIAVDSVGNVYVTEFGNDRVQVFSSSGTFLRMWGWGVDDGTTNGFQECTSTCHPGFEGEGERQFYNPTGVATDSARNVYVVSGTGGRIQKLAPDATFLDEWGGFGTLEGLFNAPNQIAIDTAGDVYVADLANHRVQQFTAAGTFVRMWGRGVDNGDPVPQVCTSGCLAGTTGSGPGEFNGPNGVAVDPSGDVYVADSNNDRVQRFTSTGTFVSAFGSSGSGQGQFAQPNRVATDCRGNVYVTDSNNHLVQKFGEPLAAPPPCLPVDPGPDKAARTLSLKASKKAVRRGKKVRLTGAIESSASACQAGQAIQLERKQKGTGFKALRELTTDQAGSFATKVKVRKTAVFRAEVRDSAACAGDRSPNQRVKAKKRR